MLSMYARRVSPIIREITRSYHSSNCHIHEQNVINDLIKFVPSEYQSKHRRTYVEKTGADHIIGLILETENNFMRRCGRNLTISEIQLILSKMDLSE